jgi:hypothetical protein
MKVIKTRIIPPQPERSEEYVADITCDLCSRGGGGRQMHNQSISWSDKTDLFDIDLTTIRREEGKSYPEGGSTEVMEFHICPDCWDVKLVPWLTSQSAKPTCFERDV